MSGGHGADDPGQDASSAGTATATGQVAVPDQAELVPQRPEPRPPLVLAWPADPDRPGEPVPLRDRWCFVGVFLISLLVFISADTGRRRLPGFLTWSLFLNETDGGTGRGIEDPAYG